MRIITAVLGMLLVAIAGCANGGDRPSAREAVTSSGTIERGRPINDGWRFLRADEPRAMNAAFDDSAWERISLPHTWNLLDGSDGGNNYYRGRAWYRRAIDVDGHALKQGKRFFVRFGAATLVADVYVNGQHVGVHRGGYAAFCFDITDQLHAGRNELSVRVDNTKAPDIAPQSGDFTVFGGLTRAVRLIVLDPLHITPTDDASSGVYVTPSAVGAEHATVDVVTKVRNDSEKGQRGTVTIALQGGEKRTPIETPFTAEAGAEVHVSTRIEIDHPHLWDGVRDPAMYLARVTLRDEQGVTRDAIDQTFGLRQIEITADRGLLLNGTHYDMFGVNTHQEVGGKGPAGTRGDYEHMYRLIRAMGTTTVRMAHYQHNENEYALCDELGLLVWSEVPLVDAFGTSPEFGENLKQQLRELIKQNYNHPSVFVWGLLNEVMLDESDSNWELVRECNRLARTLDPSRPTTMAQNTPPTHASLKISDVIAFNRYTGWYGGDAKNFGQTIDKDRAANPSRAIAISEYGAGASIDQHELRPRPASAGGPWHPEEYQTEVHEHVWAAIHSRPHLWASYLWNMYDFSSDRRAEGNHDGRNDKGLVTFDQRTRKDAYYFYQSMWTTTPMAHITAGRFDPYPIGRSVVKVYSNCDTVELIQNGQSLGTQHAVEGVFTFSDVIFQPGKATTIARGVKGAAIVEDRVVRNVSATASTRTTPPTTRSATRSTTAAASRPATQAVEEH